MDKTVTFNLNNREWYIGGNKALNLLDTTADRVILDKYAVDVILSRGFKLKIHIHRINGEFIENEGKVAPNKTIETLNKNDIAIINVIYKRHTHESEFTTIYKIDGKIYWFESLREAQNNIITKYR